MLRLGRESAAQSATPWKWATAASLLLALGLAVRPAFVSTAGTSVEVANQSETAVSQPAQVEAAVSATAIEAATPAVEAAVRDKADWLVALASGSYDSSQPLSVRPQFAPGAGPLRTAEVAVRDDSQEAVPPREPMLRWGDQRFRRDKSELMVLPRT